MIPWSVGTGCGDSGTSAQELNEIVLLGLPEPTIFRIDHVRSSDFVRLVSGLRFLNRNFEPVWNTCNIYHVDISWLES
jgi:glucose-6-phosphate 1-dehydrogenase